MKFLLSSCCTLIMIAAVAQKKMDLSASTTGERLIEIPAKVFDAKDDLGELYLSGNNFKELPDGMSTLIRLEKLDLINCFDSVVRPDVFRPLIPLNNLRALWVSGAMIAKTNLNELGHLEFLYWHGLDKFPPSFCELIKLKELYIATPEEFKTLPTDFTKLLNLERLTIRSSSFQRLPAGFGKLKNLQTIDMKLSQLASLPEDFGQLKNLTVLDLEYSKINSLPDGFGKLEKLQSLNLAYTKIQALPADFTQLQKLERLDLSYSEIAKLPANILDLKQLKYLFIASTPNLISLPLSFANLLSLKMLNLHESGL